MASRLFTAGLLLVVLAAASFPAPVQAQGFNAVYTQDGADVWAVGDAGIVYRSLDGGAIWGSYPMGAVDHNAVSAKGIFVWVVDDGGAVWRSTNTGNTFASTSPAGAVDLNCLWFDDNAVGWAAGNGGTILKTTDSGANWSSQVSGTVANLYAIRFSSATDGWACGAAGTVLRSTDGGGSWSVSTPFGSFTKALYDVDFDGSTVYISGTYGFLGKSTNDGSNWTTVDLWMDSRGDVNGVEVLPGGSLWLCGGGGFLRKSTDGAVNWTYPQHPIVTGLTDVYFYDANKAWACAGKTKNIARTTDGGATWSVPGGGAFTYSWALKQTSGGVSIRGDALDIDPINRDKIYAVQGLTVYASWNRGDTWTSIATITGGGTKTNSFFVSPTDTNTWVAAVQSTDRITKTTNGGASWTSTSVVDFTEYGMPLEQDINNKNTLYFGPEDGRLYKSTDFGSNWTAISEPGFRSPCDLVVVARDPSRMYCGDGITSSGSGDMFTSTDAGLNWSLNYTTSGSEIPTIGASWLDNTVGFATSWSSGGVRRTTNMGATWTSVATTSSAWGSDVSKDDPYVSMYGVYSGGTTYLSTNNGASFMTAALAGSNYAVVTYDRGTYLSQQSGGLYKATISQPDMPVNNAQLLTLVSPNGAEAWQYNSVHSLTWTTQNIGTVKIEYQTVPAGPWQVITLSTPAPAGSYPWVIPNAPATQALVRVSDTNDANPVDVSNSTFNITVPTIATVQPSVDYGDVTVSTSKIDTIRIVNSGTATLVISSVTLQSGGPFTPSRTSFSIPAGSSDTLAITFTPTAVQSYNDVLQIASNAPTAQHDVPLSGSGLDAVVLALAIPDGGEQWQYNTLHDVTWSTNLVGNVTIEYETSGAGPWISIAASVPAQPALYAWTIPNDATTDARVRVTDLGNPLRFDESAAPFSILVQSAAANPTDLDFGEIPNLWTSELAVEVVNSGTAPLTVSSITSDEPAFSPSQTAFVVAPASAETVMVAFSPTAEQIYTGNLTITTDAPTPNVVVTLSGRASSPVGVAGNGALPTRFELRGSLPNPFGHDGTAISYALPRESDVELVVYDASGRSVATLVHGRKPAGLYVVEFPNGAVEFSRPASALPSGVYFYRLTAGEFTETKRMVLVR